MAWMGRELVRVDPAIARRWGSSRGASLAEEDYTVSPPPLDPRRPRASVIPAGYIAPRSRAVSNYYCGADLEPPCPPDPEDEMRALMEGNRSVV